MKTERIKSKLFILSPNNHRGNGKFEQLVRAINERLQSNQLISLG